MNKEELLKAIEQKRQEIRPTDTGEMKPATVPNNLELGWLNALTWMERYIKSLPTELVNFDEAEKEKYRFVSGQFIECRASFNGFKEDNSYWLEYVGDDNYIGRSDNILNQKFHITPRQLFTLFTQEHCPKGECGVSL